MLQKYGNAPGLLKVLLKAPFLLSVELSKAPSKLGEIPEVAVCGTLSRLVQVTVVPTEMVKLSNVNPCIWEDLAPPAERAPGVGVGAAPEPELEPPPVKGVALGEGNLVAVGRITVALTWGIGVEVANSDLAAGTNGVAVARTRRVSVGGILKVGVGAPLTLVGAAARVTVAMGGRVASAAALGVLVAMTAPVVAAGRVGSLEPTASLD